MTKKKNFINCLKCKHHNYDSFFGSDDEWEICEKRQEELYPSECEWFEPERRFTIKNSNSYYVGFDIIDHENNRTLYGGRLAQCEELCNFLNEIAEQNKQLKKAFIDNIKICSDEEFNETKHINNIYRKKGFDGVIDYAKNKLYYYGGVKEVEEGLWVMVTGGWSDNEHFIHCLNSPLSDFSRKHYRAYEKGGAFYYTTEPRADVKISLRS